LAFFLDLACKNFYPKDCPPCYAPSAAGNDFYSSYLGEANFFLSYATGRDLLSFSIIGLGVVVLHRQQAIDTFSEFFKIKEDYIPFSQIQPERHYSLFQTFLNTEAAFLGILTIGSLYSQKI
jgi:hypothetical protein